jgi:hypothetical protein
MPPRSPTQPRQEVSRELFEDDGIDPLQVAPTKFCCPKQDVKLLEPYELIIGECSRTYDTIATEVGSGENRARAEDPSSVDGPQSVWRRAAKIW